MPYVVHNGRGVGLRRRCRRHGDLRWRGPPAPGSRTAGSGVPARRCSSGWAYALLLPSIAIVAVCALPDLVPLWVLYVGWAVGGLGIGLGYAAHSQLTLRCSPATECSAATASLQLLDNLGVALGTGFVGPS